MNYLADAPAAPAAGAAAAPAATVSTDTKDKDEAEDKLEKAKKLAHQKVLEVKAEANKKVNVGGHTVAMWVPVLCGIIGTILLCVGGYFAYKHFNKAE